MRHSELDGFGSLPSSLDPESARETMEILYEVSKILNTGLDRNTLSILVGLCESGVNPEALAAVVKELRREGAALEVPHLWIPLHF